MKTLNLKQLKIVYGLPPVAKKGDKISIDSEFFGQEKTRLHRPHGEFAFLGCSFDGVKVYYITDSSQIQEFFDHLDAGVWIFHHAKYDLTQLRRFAHIPQRKRLWDTMLIEQIMYSGYFNDFSLSDVARRRLDLYLPKEVRAEFGQKIAPEPSGGHLGVSQEQVEYAAGDVVATFQVYQSQRAEIDETDLEIWKNIELPFLWTLLSMGGVKLDTESWITLARKNEKIAKDIQDKYGKMEIVQGKRSTKEVFSGLNLNSPKQVKEHFISLGEKVKSTGVEVLETLIDRDGKVGKFANDLMTYRTYSKRASTYGEKFITDHVEPDGKIYADIHQIGAETARTSCRHPNLQNQPNEVEYRSCFIAEEGNVMIVADYGSQEPRISAYFTQDPGLISVLNSDRKLYIVIAKDALNLDVKKGTKEYDDTKSTILGIFYGMSAYGLAQRIGVSEEEAQDMINKIIQTYPGIQDYIDRQKQAEDYVHSIYGRKIWLNKYDKGWLRTALNYPIQSSAADATKLATHRFLEIYGEGEQVYDESPLLLLVHDELVIEVPEQNKEKAMMDLECAMVQVAEEMHDGLKGVAEVFHGHSWACKH